MNRLCLNCAIEIIGRVDNKYCNEYCRSNHHNEKRKIKEATLFSKIEKQLKLNRRLLRDFNRAGKSTVRKEKFIEAGFDPNYFTHYWKNQKGDVYLFCFDYGFLKVVESGKTKYVLVEHQKYMKKER